MADERLRTDELASEIIDPGNCNCVYRSLIEDRDFPMGVIRDWGKYELGGKE